MSRNEQSKPRIEFDPDGPVATLGDFTAAEAERVLALARREFIAQTAVEFAVLWAKRTEPLGRNTVLEWLGSHSPSPAKNFTVAANEIWIEASKIAGVEP